MAVETKQRFLALDVFRGMTICFMIIVNTSGSKFTYSPLEHAAWHGFTPTDLVFPSFLFAVGNAMSFVIKKWNIPHTVSGIRKNFQTDIHYFSMRILFILVSFF